MNWYDSLVSMVERESHSKFKQRPRLTFTFLGPPTSSETVIHIPSLTSNRKLKVHSVSIPLRLIGDPQLMSVALAHELRENLGVQHGLSPSQAHRLAQKSERKICKKLGIRRNTKRLLKDYFQGQRLLI